MVRAAVRDCVMSFGYDLGFKLESDGLAFSTKPTRTSTPQFTVQPYPVISVKKLNSLKHLVRTTVAGSHN